MSPVSNNQPSPTTGVETHEASPEHTLVAPEGDEVNVALLMKIVGGPENHLTTLVDLAIKNTQVHDTPMIEETTTDPVSQTINEVLTSF